MYKILLSAPSQVTVAFIIITSLSIVSLSLSRILSFSTLQVVVGVGRIFGFAEFPTRKVREKCV
jgi:hypothetical protein